MVSDRNCKVRRFKGEVRGLCDLGGQRQIHGVTDLVGLLEPRGERLTDVHSYNTVMDGAVRSGVNHKMVTLFYPVMWYKCVHAT